jgi:hypothetical protein
MASTRLNFGNALTIDVKKNNSRWNRYSYLKFDIRSIASVQHRQAADVRKTRQHRGEDNPDRSLRASRRRRGARPRSTGTTSPRPARLPIGKFTVTDTTARYYEVDISKYVKDQKAAGKTVIAIAAQEAASSPRRWRSSISDEKRVQ